MADKVGVVYGIEDRLIRQIIVPDSDEELNDPAFVGTGEAMMQIERSIYQQYRNHVALALALGLSG